MILRAQPLTKRLQPGYVFFVGATAETVFEADSDDQFVTFKAFCELDGKSGKL